jgi:hypothetical protein
MKTTDAIGFAAESFPTGGCNLVRDVLGQVTTPQEWADSLCAQTMTSGFLWEEAMDFARGLAAHFRGRSSTCCCCA